MACGFSLEEITWHFASGGLMLALGFGLFALGWIGGGDAKLAAATAIWLGFDELGHYALAASLS
ncbi:MAG: prepilin peptidase, partial [Acidobacteriota bacterium]|nr:prepilin peptidase [Acidobacteriota bacterium]